MLYNVCFVGLVLLGCYVLGVVVVGLLLLLGMGDVEVVSGIDGTRGVGMCFGGSEAYRVS